MTQAGMIGLGRMGSGMVRRMMAAGHTCVVYDVIPEAVQGLAAEGAIPARSEAELVDKLAAPRVVWIMLPAARVDAELAVLAPLLQRGDTVVDGGNSHYRDDIRRASELAASGFHHVDVGTSGGIWGEHRGYCLMIGGEAEVTERLAPLFAALAPGTDAAPRTPGRPDPPRPEEQGWLVCGSHGAGHFVKMVHNGIEYGLMAAYAEGFNVLRNADVGCERRAASAETAPLDHPELYQYTFDLAAVAEVWRRGSVIGSWLLDLSADALLSDPDMKEFSRRVADSGEGRWTLLAALDEAVPTPALSAALFARFASRGEADFADRLLSAMRHEFGGHPGKSRKGGAL
jgi:6-phosphogluconate dehydrogenase